MPRQYGPEERRLKREYYQANRDRILESRRESYDPEKRREYLLRKKYAIGLADYESMLYAQGGGCAICGDGQPRDGVLKVDHDHVTGEVRGLLCQTCNLGLGHFKDSPDILDNAAEYLRGSSV